MTKGYKSTADIATALQLHCSKLGDVLGKQTIGSNCARTLDVRRGIGTQQQAPESPYDTLTWHAMDDLKC